MKRISSVLFAMLAAISLSHYQPVQAQTTEAVAPKDKVQLADNAPDSYTVVKGDTLWGIASKFLKTPWRWPEVWNLNKDEIKNPHRIYPGQTVYLDRNKMTLSLTPPTAAETTPSDMPGFVKLSPKVYEYPVASAISSVPLTGIQQFLVEPLFLDTEDPSGAGTVIAVQENRVMAATSEVIFARNLQSGESNFSIFRPGKPIKDPVNEKVLGYEADFVGRARIEQNEQAPVAASLRATNVVQDISVGDRLLPATKDSVFAFVPHSPAAGLDARVASIHGGVDSGARYSVITISAGRSQGIEPGHVVALQRNRGAVSYRGPNGGEKEQKIQLPIQRYGLGFVFRVFNNLSYVLVLESETTVVVGDSVTAP